MVPWTSGWPAESKRCRRIPGEYVLGPLICGSPPCVHVGHYYTHIAGRATCRFKHATRVRYFIRGVLNLGASKIEFFLFFKSIGKIKSQFSKF